MSAGPSAVDPVPSVRDDIRGKDVKTVTFGGDRGIISLHWKDSRLHPHRQAMLEETSPDRLRRQPNFVGTFSAEIVDSDEDADGDGPRPVEALVNCQRSGD